VTYSPARLITRSVNSLQALLPVATRSNWDLSGAAFTGFDFDFTVDSFGLFSFGDGSAGSMQASIDDNAVGAVTAVPEPSSTAVNGAVTLLALRPCCRQRRLATI
jgi:hypothetical protein